MGCAFIADQGKNILIKNFAFAVCQVFELDKGIVDVGFTFHRNTEFLQPLLERIAATQLAQHNFIGRPAHIFGAHDFIGVTGFKHTVLMNA